MQKKVVFVKEMPQDLKKEQKFVKEFKTDDKVEEIKQQKKLKFLQAVLKSDYGQSHLDLKDFNLTKVYEAKNLNEFEIALENACYSMKRLPFNEGTKDYFLKEFSVSIFKLTSYDLEGRHKNTHQSLQSEQRSHTKTLARFLGKRRK